MTKCKGILCVVGLLGALAASATAQHSGPVRIVRLSYVQGSVDWRPASSVGWSRAARNLPIREGSQIWAPNGGRAELVFDDGAVLRIGGGGLVTLHSLYSDTNGEFTNIQLTEGDADLSLRHGYSVYQFDTPYVSVRGDDVATVRLRCGPSDQVEVRRGSIQCESHKGRVVLAAGRALEFKPDGTYYPASLPAADDWDRFNDNRDRVVLRTDPNIPANVALVSGELDDYGTWRDVPHRGHVWYPRAAEAGWRPYHDGNWVWVEPMGWTWVGNEPWGWAPYHYGSWTHTDEGWGWVPGPRTQYWSPAVVSFTTYGGGIAWAPLAPEEVRYPAALSVGFRSGDWSLFFSVGGCADYYPVTTSYCQAYPFDPAFLSVSVNIGANFNNYRTFNGGGYFHAGPRFVPQNSFRVAGASFVGSGQFGRSSGGFRALGTGGGTYFRQGRSFAPSVSGRPLRATPMFARPTLASLSPSRTFIGRSAVPRSVAARPVFHAAAWSSPAQRADRFTTTRPTAVRPGAARPSITRPTPARTTSAAAAANARRAADARAAASARSALGYRRSEPAHRTPPTRTAPTRTAATRTAATHAAATRAATKHPAAHVAAHRARPAARPARAHAVRTSAVRTHAAATAVRRPTARRTSAVRAHFPRTARPGSVHRAPAPRAPSRSSSPARMSAPSRPRPASRPASRPPSRPSAGGRDRHHG